MTKTETEYIEELLDNDGISPREEGFMLGEMNEREHDNCD